MEKIKDYLSNPATRISFIVFIFGLGAVWWTLNNRIQQIEKFQAETDMVKIQATLSQIQTDIERIKYQLKK